MRRLDDSFGSRVRRAVGMAALYRNPILAYGHRAGMVQNGTVTHRLRRGPALTVDAGPADIRVINEIWLGGYAGDPGLIPHDGWTVVDLGANKGIYAAWVLHRADAKVYCYEPDPRNYACLIENVGARVCPFNAAVGSGGGVVTLYQVPTGRALSSTVPGRLQARGTATIPIEVPLIAFKEVVETAGQIDLLKIDVEGAEYDILLGSSDDVFEPVRRIILEYDAVSPTDRDVTGQHLATRLRGLGFCVDEGLGTVAKGYGARIMSARKR
jgi:FkbM family methyltransferase